MNKVPAASEREIRDMYGVTYIPPGESGSYRAREGNLYDYQAFVRPEKSVFVERGDCAFRFVEPARVASIARGPRSVEGDLVVVLRGYMAEDRSRHVGRSTTLPYVNGCSTKQLFPPERAGDPTFQYLDIPPYSAEQSHHIHSTVRVVYILEGKGMSIVGMEGCQLETELVPGMVCILEPMCPHHFSTPQGEHLVCLPIHVWSSSRTEFDHPMWNGTHMMNQGA